MTVTPTILHRRTLKLRASRFQEDKGRGILLPREGGWAVLQGNIGFNLQATVTRKAKRRQYTAMHLTM